MRKLRLELEHLTVDSFPTMARAQTPRGTVRGRVATDASAQESCAYTCTGCGLFSNTGCSANTDFCAFDSVNLCLRDLAPEGSSAC